MPETVGKPRLLVLRPGAIGDTILTLPALSALRRSFPDAALIVAGNPAALPLVEAADLLDAWVSFDDARVTRLFVPGPPQPSDPFTNVTTAVAWCADPDGVLRSGLQARGAQQVVIAPSRPRGPESIHVACHLLRTVADLVPGAGMSDDETLPTIVPPVWAVEQADTLLRTSGLDGRPFVVVHPGSGSPRKNWPADRFAAVARRLRERLGLPVIVLGGPADAEVLQRLDGLLPDSTPLLTDLPLLVVAALLQRARGFLGNDSGLGHLSGALGIPTLVLFGPTDPVLWQPLGPRVRVLRSEPLEALALDAVVAGLEALMAMPDGNTSVRW